MRKKSNTRVSKKNLNPKREECGLGGRECKQRRAPPKKTPTHLSISVGGFGGADFLVTP